jgi:hypothetical protein
VEGARLLAAREYGEYYRLKIVQHLSRWDAHEAKALSPKECISSGVPARLVSVGMRLSIDFDDEPFFKACEVGRKPADWELAAEFEAVRFLSQLLP